MVKDDGLGDYYVSAERGNDAIAICYAQDFASDIAKSLNDRPLGTVDVSVPLKVLERVTQIAARNETGPEIDAARALLKKVGGRVDYD